jgi:uncharacterized protein YbjT (DUF2867 family)
MRVLVVGGSGALGRDLTRALALEGHSVKVAARRRPPAEADPSAEWARLDLVTGEGLREAVEGAAVVVHLASDPRRPELVDVAGTARLVDEARAARVSHFIYVSIVGVDAIPLRYYRCKLAAELSVAGAGLPFSILRTTQFHGYLARMLSRLAGLVPLVMPVPAGFRIQSIATADVAGRMLRAVADGPAGRLSDLGGPEVLGFAEAARLWRDARGVHKRVWSFPTFGRLAAAFRAGRNTVLGEPRGRVTFGEWLESSGAPQRADARGRVAVRID